jgi:uncharacterized membrane protein YhaH (DUF805 family)
MELVNLLFTFNGRINRAKYWLACLIWLILWVVVAVAIFLMQFATVIVVVAIVIFIPSIVSGIAIGIKRLHDRDKSGWWLLLFYLTPGVLDGIGRTAGSVGFVFSLASLAITIWAFVELGCLRGTIGKNRYGGDPLAPKLAQH